MELVLRRFYSQPDYTISYLSFNDRGFKQFVCFALEDEFRKVKVKKETRIPAGSYKLDLREEGSLTKKYAKKYPRMHQGMIWLRKVLGFKYIYIHVGNTDDDTEGCIVVGEYNSIIPYKVSASIKTYGRIYPMIAAAIKAGPTYITVIDDDTPPDVG